MEESKPQPTTPPKGDAVPPQNATGEPRTQAPKDVALTAQVVPSKKNQEPRCECRPDQTPLWKKVLETAAVIIGLYVAFIYSSQLTQMIESNRLTKIALNGSETRARMEDRPYVTVAPRYGGMVENIKKEKILAPIRRIGQDAWEIDVAIDYKIVGRSLATEIINTPSQIIVGPKAEAFDKAVNYVPEYGTSTGLSMIPDEAATVLSGRATVNGKVRDLLAAGAWAVYVVGGIQYRDVFTPRLDHPYEVVYCFSLNPTGLPFGSCVNKKSRRNQN